MNKAEAIEIIKTAMVYTPEEMEALETLIPELKESEDERIRKTLINALKTTKSVGELKFVLSEPIREECITYLEKQKEQKSVDIEYKLPLDAEKQKEIDDTSSTIQNFFNKEQKPTGWIPTEEDKKKIQEILEPSYEIHCGLCRSLCPQQKVEWSEEDEIYLQDALWCVKQASKVARGENDMGACWSAERWLKSLPERLNLQPNCPQNKIHYWTEEEIEPIVSDYLTGKEHYGGMMARLRCLKPKFHWKPSEEQMKALLNAEGYLRAGLQHDSAKTIAELYEQLKKLI